MLESTLSVATDGMLAPTPYITLAMATAGFILSSAIIEISQEQPSGASAGSFIDLTSYYEEQRRERLNEDDNEIVAVIISFMLTGLLK